MTDRINHNKTRIFVAGHKGMVGRALVRRLAQDTSVEVITADRKDLDLTNQAAVHEFVRSQRLDEVYLAAAKVGGIHANNTYPAEFIYQNLMIQCNVIQAAHQADINRLLFLGSSCIYPKVTPQPISEQALLSGRLEPTNEPYAIAKIAGIKLCESYNRQYDRDYRCLMPTNLYGPYDNFHPQNSHVIPGMLRRFHEAKCANADEVVVWGTGNPRREFLHVDDLARASVYFMQMEQPRFRANLPEMNSHLNIGAGGDIAIKELAELIKQTIGFSGDIHFDTSKPDGTQRKLMDSSLAGQLGWKPEIAIEAGLKSTYQWYVENGALS